MLWRCVVWPKSRRTCVKGAIRKAQSQTCILAQTQLKGVYIYSIFLNYEPVNHEGHIRATQLQRPLGLKSCRVTLCYALSSLSQKTSVSWQTDHSPGDFVTEVETIVVIKLLSESRADRCIDTLHVIFVLGDGVLCVLLVVVVVFGFVCCCCFFVCVWGGGGIEWTGKAKIR